MRVFLFFSSFCSLANVRTKGARKFRVSKGNCGLRHAKKCQWQRVIHVVSNKLFICFANKKQVLQKSQGVWEQSRRVLLGGADNLLASINPCCFYTREVERGDKEE